MYPPDRTEFRNEFARTRRLIHWGILALIMLIGTAIVVSMVLRLLSPATYPGPRFYFFPFLFPFGLFLFFFLFWGLGWFLRPWRWGWGYRGGYWYNRYDATEIVRQRYARGEITRDQYDQMLRDLQQARP